ncbi:DNA-binding domain-containing protein [Pseudomonas synxantha]|nr:DNA-binding domain-containing protein [Pseudomonas synxantha]
MTCLNILLINMHTLPTFTSTDITSAAQQLGCSRISDTRFSVGTPRSTHERISGQSSSLPDPTAIGGADYLDTLLDMDEMGEAEMRDPPPENVLEISIHPSNNPSQVFLNRVRKGIQSHELIINDTKAKIHAVSGTMFLVTPGLFQRYVQEFPGFAKGVDQEIEEWRWVQKQFEKLKVHRTRVNGLNIWACQVQGPREGLKYSPFFD